MKRLLLCISFVIFHLSSGFAQKSDVVYLSGHGPEDAVKWDFWCSEGMKSGKWGKIDVPSCWEQQGFGGLTYGRYYIYDREGEKKWADRHDNRLTKEYGLYRHRFQVPRQWQGRQVSIVFEGAMTDTEVKVNGQQAGDVHQGGFYRFSYDITDLLQYGKKNLLEVKVNKHSADKSVNAAERRADWWLFGGIYRPVYLVAKPQTHIDHVAIDARADGRMRLDLRCKNLKGDEQLELTIQRRGDALASGRRLIPLKAVENQTVEIHWQDIKTWDTEHPNLYDMTLRLLSNGTNVYETDETIGFRTLEFREHDGIYLNDVKLLVKGINRHCFDPETGRSVSHERNLQDIRLIKQMNMNAVRSHYPPDVDFLNLCDSLGVLYLNELAGWQNSYSDAVGHKLVREMVERDVNHPCIFIWSNGNEGGFNTHLDDDFAKYDPQHRKVVHAWADFDGLDCRHYPTMQDQAYRLDHGQNVFMMTEFLHSLYDRGQGAGLEGMWAKFCRSRLFAGGFIWAYVDETIHRRDTDKMDTYGPNAPDGIVSAERQPLGSFYTVRQVWSPIQIKDFEASPRSFRGSFAVENGYLFSRLSEVTMKWKSLTPRSAEERLQGKSPSPVERGVDGTSVVVAEGAVTLPDIAPGETGHAHFELPKDYGKGDILQLEACNQQGDTICTWTFPIKRPVEYFAANMPDVAASGTITEQDSVIVLSAGGVTAQLNKQTGLLVSLQKGNTIVPLTNGPLPVGIKAQLRSIHIDNERLRVVAKYDGGIDSIIWRMTPDGLLGMETLMLNWRTGNKMKESEYLPEKCHNLGLTFSYPEEAVSGMRWMGRGPYRVWKNRIPGTQYGIWQKDYNNTVTSEYYYPQIYPEFKGYHANLYWVTLERGRRSEEGGRLLPKGRKNVAEGTMEGSLTVYTETDGLFLRVFTAEEQRDREGRGKSVPEWPEGDLSFLLEIPAVNSQGADGNPSTIKIRKDDDGYRIKLWFQL